MIAETAQIDSGDPIAGAYGTINSAHKARGSHPLVEPAAESTRLQTGRPREGRLPQEAGRTGDDVGRRGQGMRSGLEWLP
jgi:hypothetical protein